MKKRPSSAQIDRDAKRQQCNLNLPNDADRGPDNEVVTSTSPNLSGSNQPTTSDLCVLPRSDVSNGKDRTPSPEVQETVHTTTPTNPALATCSQQFQEMELKFLRMRIQDADHSTDEFGHYQLGPWNTEARYNRDFVLPLDNDHRYHLPVDEEEIDRSETVHQCWTLTVEPVYAPIRPGLILDLGTGFGQWVREVANVHPDRKVIGIDLHFLELPETPHKADFEVDDCERDLAEREDSVTLINMRDSFLWVRNLPGLIQSIHDNLGLEGWFQNQEIRLAAWNSNKSHVRQWRDKTLDGASKLGIQLHSRTTMCQALGEAGFVEYHERHCTWTIEQFPSLRDYAILTVEATMGILYDAWGGSADLRGVANAAIEELRADDCHLEIDVDWCWAKKSGH